MALMSSRARQARKRQLIGAILIFAFVLAVAVGGVYYFIRRPPPPDSRLCPATGPLGHYVLLVDKTDPLTFVQKEAFSVMLRDLIERRTPKGYLLSVFALGEDFKETAEPLVELCNPGTGADESELTANVEKLKRQYREGYLEPMLKQFDNLLSTQQSNASPIFEMIQLVSINAFRKQSVKGERRLIIMSDMLHNTFQFSMYNSPVDFPAFDGTDYGKKVQTELQGVEVELYYLMNTPRLQTRRHVKFWEDYFNKAGARIVAVKPFEG